MAMTTTNTKNNVHNAWCYNWVLIYLFKLDIHTDRKELIKNRNQEHYLLIMTGTSYVFWSALSFFSGRRRCCLQLYEKESSHQNQLHYLTITVVSACLDVDAGYLTVAFFYHFLDAVQHDVPCFS